MRTAAEPGCTIKQLIRFLFGERDEPLHVVDAESWIYNEDIRDRANQNYWRQIFFKICTLAWHQRCVDGRCDRGKQKGVAVLRASREIIGRMHAAGARTIFFDHGLSVQVANFTTDDPSGNVPA